MNCFTQIPAEVFRLDGLRHLHLLGNRIVKIPDGIERLTQLESLDLGANPVRYISDGLCELKRLHSLSIYGGCLESVPLRIGRLPHLRRLILGNELTAIPPGIGMCRQLLRLTLSYNRLRSLPPYLGKLENLVDLRVDNNLLAYWPPTFRYLKALRWLHAEGNPLRQPPWFALELPDLQGISCCDFLLPPSEVAVFTQACTERGILLLWNRSLCQSECYEPDLGSDDSQDTN